MRQLIVLVALMVSLPAFAVDTTQCPNTFRLGYEQLIPVSQKHLERILRRATAEAQKIVPRARDLVIASSRDQYNSLKFKFIAGKDGECTYRMENGGPAGATIFSRGGEDLVRVRLPFDEEEIFITHILEDFGDDGLEAEYYAAYAIQVRVGKSAYKIGWAYNLNLKFSDGNSAPAPAPVE